MGSDPTTKRQEDQPEEISILTAGSAATLRVASRQCNVVISRAIQVHMACRQQFGQQM
jgi:hypothetical protein